MSRALESLSKIPIATLSLMIICIGTYLCQVIFDPALHHFTMNPRVIFYLNEYYRFISSTVFHGSLMHIAMNMMSFAAIGSSLEMKFGTLWLWFTILWSVMLTSALYLFIAISMNFVFGISSLMFEHSLGFSGVIFHLSVIQANLNPYGTREIFGMFRVSSYLYPWALLIALQILMPNLSFLGHLAGILCGTCQVFGLFNIILPSEEYLRQCDEWEVLRPVFSTVNFIKTPATNSMHGSTGRLGTGSLQTTFVRGFKTIWKFFRDVLHTINVAIFGYGTRNNENTRFTGEEVTALGITTGAAIEDEDWNGLPPMPAPSSGSRNV